MSETKEIVAARARVERAERQVRLHLEICFPAKGSMDAAESALAELKAAKAALESAINAESYW